MADDAKVLTVLFKAYKAGSISLYGICPHCFKNMGFAHHGECRHCHKCCGCSFNPTSHNDHCGFHNGDDFK